KPHRSGSIRLPARDRTARNVGRPHSRRVMTEGGMGEEMGPGADGADTELETRAQAENEGELHEGLSEIQRAAEDRDRDPDRLFVVGIGASAGGLEALGELVKHVPMDNMAFVVVQHLAPHHESVLPQLLSRTSKVQVQTATDGTLAEPHHVYVIPPNTHLAP